jgi:hypothetical protein
VRVAADAPGVKRTPMELTKFIPEITHAEITIDDTHVMPEAVLPGDGYTQYLKAFRTVEDVHVHAAVLGHLVRVARLYAWPQKFVQHAVALGVALRSVATMRIDAAPTHIALAGVIDASRDLVEHSNEYWSKVDEDVRHRWHRDLPLLQVADTARTQRTERAWLSVQGSPEDYR